VSNPNSASYLGNINVGGFVNRSYSLLNASVASGVNSGNWVGTSALVISVNGWAIFAKSLANLRYTLASPRNALSWAFVLGIRAFFRAATFASYMLLCCRMRGPLLHFGALASCRAGVHVRDQLPRCTFREAISFAQANERQVNILQYCWF
jgi:hypothetical protein